MEVSHVVVKNGGYPILGGRGRFWEGHRCLKWGVYFGSEGELCECRM